MSDRLDQLALLVAKPAYRELRLGDCAMWLREKWGGFDPALTLGQLAERLKGARECHRCGGVGWDWDPEGSDTRYDCESCGGTGLLDREGQAS